MAEGKRARVGSGSPSSEEVQCTGECDAAGEYTPVEKKQRQQTEHELIYTIGTDDSLEKEDEEGEVEKPWTSVILVVVPQGTPHMATAKLVKLLRDSFGGVEVKATSNSKDMDGKLKQQVCVIFTQASTGESMAGFFNKMPRRFRSLEVNEALTTAMVLNELECTSSTADKLILPLKSTALAVAAGADGGQRRSSASSAGSKGKGGGGAPPAAGGRRTSGAAGAADNRGGASAHEYGGFQPSTERAKSAVKSLMSLCERKQCKACNGKLKVHETTTSYYLAKCKGCGATYKLGEL